YSGVNPITLAGWYLGNPTGNEMRYPFVFGIGSSQSNFFAVLNRQGGDFVLYWQRLAGTSCSGVFVTKSQTWTHLAVSFSGSSVQFFQDGRSLGTTASTQSLAATS